MRDPIKLSQRVHAEKAIPSVYYPSLDEVRPLYEMAKTEPFEALFIMFRFGFVAGNHATIKRGMKRI